MQGLILANGPHTESGMSVSEETTTLGTHACPACPLCGTAGSLLHAGMQDRLFHVPGTWNSRQCGNSECCLVWLDPMPLREEIHKAYATYYTHEDKGRQGPSDRRKGLAVRLLRIYKRLLKVLIGARRERENHELMYLRDVAPGRLLEIGCGSGKRLARLAALGWQVEGQEVDEKAWAAAKAKYPFKVHLGELKALALEENAYDAVVLNHVIEHVHEPVALLEEARRLLKPGGVLVANTPNAMSQIHGLFGTNWYSLDPPRHLHLFSPRSLSILARRAGFAKHETWTSSVNADYVAASSLKIRGMGDMKAREDRLAKERRIVAGLYFQLWALRSHAGLPDSGEECTLRAIK